MENNMVCPQSLIFNLSRRQHKKSKKWALVWFQLHRKVMNFMEAYMIIKLVNNHKEIPKNSNMQRAIMTVIKFINKKIKKGEEEIEINLRECIRNVIMMSFVNLSHQTANYRMMNSLRNLGNRNGDSGNCVSLRMLNRNLINVSINAGQAKMNSKVTSLMMIQAVRLQEMKVMIML